MGMMKFKVTFDSRVRISKSEEEVIISGSLRVTYLTY
jgi:hypothetical protein